MCSIVCSVTHMISFNRKETSEFPKKLISKRTFATFYSHNNKQKDTQRDRRFVDIKNVTFACVSFRFYFFKFIFIENEIFILFSREKKRPQGVTIVCHFGVNTSQQDRE